MRIRYYLCGRSVPVEVVEQALERFDQQIGLDQAIEDCDERRRIEREQEHEKHGEALHQLRERLAEKLPDDFSAVDDFLRDKHAMEIVDAITRVAQYLPEDYDLIYELVDRQRRSQARD